MNPRLNSRWRITGQFTTTSPLHVGSGDITAHDKIADQHDMKCDVQAVTKDYQGRPCIPGTAIKGVLRAWAEQLFPNELTRIDRIFGLKDIGSKTAEAGWAEFCTAWIIAPQNLSLFEEFVPYWRADSLTGILSNVCIDRFTGAAAKSKLFYQEFVPEGVAFSVEIDATRLKPEDINFLLAILEQGASHPTHPYQFGANGADGWGRMSWSQATVKQLDVSKPPTLRQGVGFDCCQTSVTAGKWAASGVPPHYAAIELTLDFQGPFLVNDKSRAKVKGVDDRTKTNFTPLRRADGNVWLPASSFRGALRQRVEFLLRSLDASATGDPGKPSSNGPVERLFGQTSQAARLSINEFSQVGTPAFGHQDFVAIDRFTGGAADGAKFDARYADRPQLKTKLTIDLDGLQEEDLALLVVALRDVCNGKVTFGFGSAKGYGHATGTVAFDWCMGINTGWNVPANGTSFKCVSEWNPWLETSLQKLPRAKASDFPQTSPLKLVISGDLDVTQTAKGNFVYSLKYRRDGKDKNLTLNPMEHLIHNSLLNVPKKAVGVDFEMIVNKPTHIRPTGEDWGVPQPVIVTPSAGSFANPFYFLPSEDRTTFTGELDDRDSAGHERYLPNLYSGTIRVKLTTKTPLLISDIGINDPEVAGHKRYGVLMQDGEPLLASSSVRGMLRSAYEGITNSRFGVFPFNNKSKPNEANLRRLGYRMNAGEGLSVIPVLIQGGSAHLMLGTNPELPFFDNYRDRWVVPASLLHAAWIEQYETDVGPANWAIKLNGIVPKHKSSGWCWLEKVAHANPPFKFWAVREAALQEEDLSSAPQPFIATHGNYSSLNETMKAKGYFCVTNQNIKNKHDERFFFQTAQIAVPIDAVVREKYLMLIRDYQLIHDVDIQKRLKEEQAFDKYLGSEPGKTALSRHVYSEDAARFDDGTLCYATASKVNGKYTITALYPVMISRKLYDKSPLNLLPARLRPASSMKELSPADRVFGWVSQDENPVTNGEPAYRSQLRVGPVSFTEGGIKPFDPPRCLAILGQPKPQQGRFYLGKQDGAAQAEGQSKEAAGYSGTNRIRGPKVYPHHHKFEESNWKGAKPGSQNRSITGWVKEGSTFVFDLHVVNLSRLELSALVWLLSLPPDHFLRLGLGKPLGFGSISAEIVTETTTVASGTEWIAAIPKGNSSPATIDLTKLPAEFTKAMSSANGKLLPAFLKAAKGFGGIPIHYPRLHNQQGDGSEHYEWFVANEGGRKLSLPDLNADPSLPGDPVLL